MPQTGLREQNAHRESVSMTIADVARYLQDVFGQKLVAYMANVKDEGAVSDWAKEGRHPRPDTERRLRGAMQVFHLLQQDESDHTVRAWFVGLNPQLDDRSPAAVIRDGQVRDALVAAKSFLSGG